jgi:hypothetical protein
MDRVWQGCRTTPEYFLCEWKMFSQLKKKSSMSISYKIWHLPSYAPGITPSYLSKISENLCSNKNLQINKYNYLIHNCPKLMSVRKWMDKVWYISQMSAILEIIQNTLEKGSKMATVVQKQIVWAPWIKNLAESLEPHLAEIKHLGESKLWHPELLDSRKLLHATLHWKTRRSPATTIW